MPITSSIRPATKEDTLRQTRRSLRFAAEIEHYEITTHSSGPWLWWRALSTSLRVADWASGDCCRPFGRTGAVVDGAGGSSTASFSADEQNNIDVYQTANTATVNITSIGLSRKLVLAIVSGAGHGSGFLDRRPGPDPDQPARGLRPRSPGPGDTGRQEANTRRASWRPTTQTIWPSIKIEPAKHLVIPEAGRFRASAGGTESPRDRQSFWL